MLFTVLTGAGSHNTGQTGSPFLAREMQRLSDRRAMLPSIPDAVIQSDEQNLYDYVMSMPEGPAKDIAIEELMQERAKPEYWYGESRPREPTLASSSSWVEDIYYDPKNKLLTMGGRYPVYGVEPDEVAAVLNGNYSTGNGSVGRSLINLWRLKGWGKNMGKGPLP